MSVAKVRRCPGCDRDRARRHKGIDGEDCKGWWDDSTARDAVRARSNGGRTGRPTKCTQEVHDKLMEALGFGCTRRDAAHHAGIGYDTLGKWLRAGLLPTSRPALQDLRRDVLAKEATAKVRAIGFVYKAAELGEWKAAAWWLERKFPSEWGRRLEVQHLDDPVARKVAHMPLSQLVHEVQSGVESLGGRAGLELAKNSNGRELLLDGSTTSN